MTNSRAMIGWAMTLVLLAPLAAALTAASGAPEIWWDGRFWRLLLDTGLFAGFAAAVGVFAGGLIGRAGMVWAVIGCLPLALPGSLLGSAWIVALGRTGPLGAWLTVFDWPVAGAAVGLRYAGLAALLFASQRYSAGPAARVYRLRHGWWWLGVRPMIGPAVAAFALLYVLCGADPIMPSLFLVHTYGTQVLIQHNALADLPGAAALATPMLLAGIAAVVLIGRCVRPGVVTEPHGDDPLAWWPAVPVLCVSVGVPLGAVVMGCGSWGVFVESFGRVRPEAVRTAGLALLGGVICSALGWLIARVWIDDRKAGRVSPACLVLVNLAAPASLIALGTVSLFGRDPLMWFRDTDVPLLTAYAARFVPVAVLLLFVSGLKQPQLPDVAARLHRMPRFKRWAFLGWPAWRAPLLGALLVSVLLISTELEASLMLSPAGTGTLGVRLYTLIHTAPDAMVSGAALAVIVMLLPLLLGVGWWAIRGRA